MARNSVNAEMLARKGRRRVQELLALGMRNADAVTVAATEFCVEVSTIYQWRSQADIAALNTTIAKKEAEVQEIWDGVQALARHGKDHKLIATTRKVAAPTPKSHDKPPEGRGKQTAMF